MKGMAKDLKVKAAVRAIIITGIMVFALIIGIYMPKVAFFAGAIVLCLSYFYTYFLETLADEQGDLPDNHGDDFEPTKF